MTSTATPTPPTNIYPQLRALNPDGQKVIINMESLTAGQVQYSEDVSWPLGKIKTDWSGTQPWVGEVKLNQSY